MTLVAEIDGVALPDGALLITGGEINGINGLPTSAYYGEALTGGLQVDDPNGDIELEGLHVLTVDETACTGAERIWTGWISGRRVGRGPLPYKSGVSRVWDVDIIEANWAFALMVFRASSAKRPAETDLVRAQFIIESAPMAFTPVVDNGRANFTDNPVNFDESDLVTKYPIEGFNEFVGISGKNFYAYWDHDEAELSLHYDLMGVGPTSTLAISNDIADTDSTTIYPFLDAQLNMTGAWTVTGMLLGYRGAYAYGIRQATIDALSPTVLSPSEFQRDEVYRTDRIGREATANAQIVSMLEARAEDQTTITVSIRVPASQCNLIEAGMLVPFKATHIPGYEDFVNVPVIRRTVVPTEGRTDTYDLHLELSGSPGIAGPGGGDPGDFPSRPCVAGFVQIKVDHDGIGNPSVTLDTSPGVGNTLIMWLLGKDATPTPPTGFTQIEGVVSYPDAIGFDRATMYYRVVESGDGSTYTWLNADPSWIAVAEFEGVGTLATSDSVTMGTSPTNGTPWPVGTVTASVPSVLISIGGFGDNDPPGETLDPVDSTKLFDTSSSAPWWAAGWRQVDPGTYTEDYVVTSLASGTEGSAGIVALFEVGVGGCCPDAGEWTPWVFVAQGDGTTTDFTIPCAYADLSLQVQVDGQPVIIGLTETDPEAGEFSLDFAPLAAEGDAPAEQVWARYQGR